MAVEFTTRQFEAAHGKQPKGCGSWAFCPQQNANRDNYLDFTFWHNGTYSEAKSAARKHFNKQPGVNVVVVLS